MHDGAGDALAVSVRISDDGHTVHLALAGELDVRSTGRAAREIDAALRAAGTDVFVDASELGFVDVDGLNLLAAVARRVAGDGGTMRLQGASPLLVRMLQETGLDELVALDG